MADRAPLPVNEREALLRRRATNAAVAAAVMLIAIKTAAWVATGSVSVLSSLLDSLLDCAASVLNFIAVRLALTPADREHRFGHGKAEPLAGLGQAAFVTGSAVLLIAQAAQRLYSAPAISSWDIGLAVMVVSIVITLALVRYQRHVVEQTRSLAISADELHYRGDLVLNGSVILSLVLAGQFGWSRADPVFGIAIALWIVWSAWQIVRQSMTHLMDKELPDTDRARIRAIAEAHAEVSAVYEIRTRASGPTSFIQFHIEMDPGMTLARAHEVSDAIEASIHEAFPSAEVIIHQEPLGMAARRRDPATQEKGRNAA
jgi:ferrous-iron efflux pump FieF